MSQVCVSNVILNYMYTKSGRENSMTYSMSILGEAIAAKSFIHMHIRPLRRELHTVFWNDSTSPKSCSQKIDIS